MVEEGSDYFVCGVGLVYAEWVVTVFGAVGGECEFGGTWGQVGDGVDGGVDGREWVVLR
jgi:hypothetical protein